MKIPNIIKGVSLIILIWIVNVFIAFVIFNRDTPTQPIILLWIIADVLIIYTGFKKKILNPTAMKFSGLALIVLIMLYLVSINTNIPEEARQLNDKLSGENEDRIGYAKELFLMMEDKWTSPTRQYLLEPQKTFFIKDFARFWAIDGYVPSNVQAELYLTLLLDSGRFYEDEVKVIHGWCINSPHGVVEFPDKVYADFWAKDHFEEYKFGQKTEMPCDELFWESYDETTQS